MNVGVVGLEVQLPAVGRQASRSGRVHGGTGTLAQLACRQFASVRIISAGCKAAMLKCPQCYHCSYY